MLYLVCSQLHQSDVMNCEPCFEPWQQHTINPNHKVPQSPICQFLFYNAIHIFKMVSHKVKYVGIIF